MRGAGRRALLGLAVAGTLALGTAPAVAQEEAARITGTDTHRFPEVRVTFTVPGGEVEPSAVRLTENGAPVADLVVQPIVESTTEIDVVLALDVSASMRGEPLARALEAARAFVAGLPEGSRVGVLTFAGEVRVVSPLTPNLEAVRGILEGEFEVSRGTALFDALVQAAGMFDGEGQRNVVLLANGPNNVGDTKLSDAEAALGKERTTVYSVAFRGGDADVLTMRRLADTTGGTYSSGQLAELSALYEAIASQLSSQYVATYRSTSTFGSELSIRVEGPGFTAEAVTLAPRKPRPAGPPPTVEPARPLLRGTWGLAVVGGLVFFAAFLLGVMLVGTGVRVRREREAAARMTAVARPQAVLGAQPERAAVPWIPEQMIQVGQRVAQAGGFAGTLDHKLEQAGLPLRAGEFVAATVIGALGAAVLSLLLFQNLVLVLAFTAAGGLLPWALLSRKLSQRKDKLNRQLPEVLNIMASSLRAGYSFLQALDTVAKQIPEPAAAEFNRTIAEIRLGRNVEEALNAMAERVGSDNFRWAVLAVNIQREVGGNLAEILDTVAHTVRERDELLREVDVLTTEGRISMWVLIALPVLLTVYMLAVNREYISLLWSTRVGWVMMITGASLLALGYVWIKRLVRIDV